MINEKYQIDKYEFDLLNKIVEDSEIIFSKKSTEDLIDFYNRIGREYLFKKGFSIEYNELIKEIPKDITITKLKKKEKKLESLVLDEENKSIANIIMNGNKNLISYFQEKQISPQPLSYVKENFRQRSIIFPKFQLCIKAISEISKFIYQEFTEKNPNTILIPTNTYFKINQENLELNTNKRNEIYFNQIFDPKGDFWSIFIIKQENMRIHQNFLKGYKKYKVKNLN